MHIMDTALLAEKREKLEYFFQSEWHKNTRCNFIETVLIVFFSEVLSVDLNAHSLWMEKLI